MLNKAVTIGEAEKWHARLSTMGTPSMTTCKHEGQSSYLSRILRLILV